MAKKLSIIIVTCKVRELLWHCLKSLKIATKNIDYELWVIDNASLDGTAQMVKEKFPYINFMELENNIGYAKANNLAINKCLGEYILFLNPDTIIFPDTLHTMLELMDKNKDIGVSSCKVSLIDGKLDLACRRNFPTPLDLLYKRFGLSNLFSSSKIFAHYNLLYMPQDQAYDVQSVAGVFMLTRKEIIKQVGGLDENFFMYGEDLDWCFRVYQAGFRIYYYPKTRIIHHKGASSKKLKKESLIQFYKSLKILYDKYYASQNNKFYNFIVYSFLNFRINMLNW